MICCLDVDYRENKVVTAAIGFERWDSPAPSFEQSRYSDIVPADYEPGQFYRRELPYLLQAITSIPTPPRIIVIDGYVWLGPAQPGLGAHLYESLDKTTAVIGVAKTAYRSATGAKAVLRGKSVHPLYVTAAGIDLDEAAESIRSMHGAFRIPTLLKLADRFSRERFRS